MTGNEMEGFAINFRCIHCGHNISVTAGYAGKKCKCPKCRNVISIPKAGKAGPVVSKGDFGDSEVSRKYSGFDRALLDVQQEEAASNQISSRGGMSEKDFEEWKKSAEKTASEEAEPFGIRRLPWIIDIFLYPLSFWGLVNLTIFIGVPLLLDFLQKIMIIQLSCLFFLLALVIRVIVYLFMYWYFAECVRDSAEGGLRAPNVRGYVPGTVDMFWQMVNMIGCFGVFFMPFVIYVLIARKAGVIFWLLLIYAIFSFPIALLAVVVLDSPAGLNPRLLYKSISNTFRKYSGLVLLFVAAVSLMGLLGQKVGESGYLAFIVRCASVYIVFVAAHLLGRFYWRNQEKLKWKVAES
jgi:phage FluMu protein Com